MAARSDQAQRDIRGWAASRCLGVLAGARSYLGSTRREIACDVIALCIGMLVVLPAMALVLDRRPVLEVSPVVILPDPAIPAKKMRLEWSTITYRDCDGEVRQRIEDSTGRIFYYVPETPAYKELGKRQFFSRELLLPRGTAPGPAVYVSQISRWCNELQRMVWPMKEETRVGFMVGTP